ncbi:MAG TPA: ABC transporter ATP-binding protein [Candidatus Limnocylindrales bacterium]
MSAAANQAPAIRAAGLGRRFGDTWAVRNLTFDVAPGEVLGLLGPNGAGKTTTVRMLTALIAATEGDAWIDGCDVRRDAEAVRTRVGVLTETPGLYEKLSALANLEFFGRLHRLPREVADERIRRLLTLFDLWDRRNDSAGTFSKGMKQKLAIARALLHEPAVLFLDEPTAALDPEAAFLVRDAISRLRAAGRTIVLATHNLDEASRLCDRIAFIRGGLLRIDSPARLQDEAGHGRVSIVVAGSSDGLAETVRGLSGVRAVGVEDGRLDVDLDDPARDTPPLVRAVVEAGGQVLEVRRRAATLEDVYFEVMGVRPGAGGELD